MSTGQPSSNPPARGSACANVLLVAAALAVLFIVQGLLFKTTTIFVTPGGSDCILSIDGKGQTPTVWDEESNMYSYEFGILIGSHRIRISKPGYRTYETILNVPIDKFELYPSYQLGKEPTPRRSP